MDGARAPAAAALAIDLEAARPAPAARSLLDVLAGILPIARARIAHTK